MASAVNPIEEGSTIDWLLERDTSRSERVCSVSSSERAETSSAEPEEEGGGGCEYSEFTIRAV